LCLFGVVSMLTATAIAQSTSFTYQGNLNSTGSPATGSYDFEFRLYDSASNGNQLGSTLMRDAVQVSGGAFTVDLDFGNQFPGAARYLEIRVRLTGSGGHTILAPRQPISTIPYAMRSLAAVSATSAENATTATTATNALQLGGVAANQFVLTGDARMTDARQPLAGSANYIQNQDAAPQPSAFSITDTGKASWFDAGGYRIDGIDALRVSNGTERNLAVGRGQTPFLFDATSTDNVFIGNGAGAPSSGVFSGQSNVYIGRRAGSETSGNLNTFVGADTYHTGANYLGNTVIGAKAKVTSGNPQRTNATAVGYLAQVDRPNSLVLGSVAGVNTATTTVNVGIGTTSPLTRLHVANAVSRTLFGELDCNNNFAAIGFATTLDCGVYSIAGDGNSTLINRRAGHFVIFREGNSDQLTIQPGGTLLIPQLAAATSPQATLCRNTSNQLAFCSSSSSKYKTNIRDFTDGLETVKKLRPVTYTLKSDGNLDYGLVAEEVNAVIPEMTYPNENGEVDGVRYDRLPVLLIDAIKQQQELIEELTRQVCELSPKAKICKPTKNE